MKVRKLWYLVVILLINSVNTLVFPYSTSRDKLAADQPTLDGLKGGNNAIDTFDYMVDSAPPSPFSIMEHPTTGMVNILAIPIYFTDQPFSTSVATLDSRWDGTGNSVRTYYLENSFGQLSISVNTLTWSQAPLSISYYADLDHQEREFELAEWAFGYWDSTIDYTEYHYIYIIYAGTDVQDDTHFWPHVWTWYPGYGIETGDDVQYDKLGFVGEESLMGAYAHEFGHSLGLVDYYSATPSYYPCGYWEIMAIGSYNGGGDYPSHMGAYSKIELGWITESQVCNLDEYGNIATIKLHSLEDANCSTDEYYAAKIPYDTQCYYLVEFRDSIGYDQYLPDKGVLVSFVNESKGSTEGRLTYYGGDHSDANLIGVELDDSETDPDQRFVRWVSDDITVAAVHENSDNMEVYIDFYTDVSSGWDTYTGLGAGSSLFFYYENLSVGDIIVFFWDTTAGSGSDFYLHRDVGGTLELITSKIDIRQDVIVFRVTTDGTYRIRVHNNNILFTIDVFYKDWVLPCPSLELLDYSFIDSFYLLSGHTQSISFWAIFVNNMLAWDEDVNISLFFSESLMAITNGSTFYEFRGPWSANLHLCEWEFMVFEVGIVNITLRIQGLYSYFEWTISFEVLDDDDSPIIYLSTYDVIYNQVHISWNVEDDGSGFSYSELYLNDFLMQNYFSPTGSYTIILPQEGLYDIMIKAYDNFGNEALWKGIAIYDITPPELVQVLSDTTDVSGQYTLKVELYDNVVPIFNLKFSIKGTVIAEFGTNESIVEVTFNSDDFITDTDSELNITVQMRDIMFNERSEVITLTLRDNSNPNPDNPNLIWIGVGIGGGITVIAAITIIMLYRKRTSSFT